MVVTPFAGVWIEITPQRADLRGGLSLPSRECGLKLPKCNRSTTYCRVTPFAGVWIEIDR